MTENTKKWVKALRSGKYAQRRGYLQKDGKFCCLGIACEVAIENGVLLERTTTEIAETRYNGCSGVLPKPVIEWLGCFDDGCLSQERLIHLNDREQLAFGEIANYIEEHAK